MLELELQPAQQKHVPGIIHIIKASFDEPLSEYTAIGQPGYARYLSDVVAEEPPTSKVIFVGLLEDELAAFADVTIRPSTTNFLTRIAVEPRFRGRGLARALMGQIHKAHGEGNGWSLDVFHTNSGALRLYRALGFEVASTHLWFTRHPARLSVPTSLDAPGQFCNDPSYSRYGFTKVKIAEHEVSIAGSAVRCPNEESFGDDSLFAKVKALYPRVDRSFTVLDAAASYSSLPVDAYEIGRSYRMMGTF